MLIDIELLRETYEGKVICPHCGSKAVLTRNSKIYGHSYGNGWAWVCKKYPTCDSYVGCHADGTPLGTPANKELRTERKLTHSQFDPLWQTPLKTERGNRRSFRYAQLAQYLGISTRQCHIGMFDMSQCWKAQEFCRLYAAGQVPNVVNNPKNRADNTGSKLWSQHVDNPIVQSDL